MNRSPAEKIAYVIGFQIPFFVIIAAGLLTALIVRETPAWVAYPSAIVAFYGAMGAGKWITERYGK